MMTKKLSNVLGVLLISALSISITSCSDDDNIPNDPEDAVTLNMLNDQNGKTQLGASNVYINKANNFYSASSFIVDAGKAGGVGVEIAPKLDNLTREAAVVPGHIYQIFDRETVRDFSPGVRAIVVGAAYYRAYVVSPITADNIPTGAVVKYVSIYPDAKGLPETEHKLAEMSSSGSEVEMKLPKGAECYWDSSTDELFDITTSDGKLRMLLVNMPPRGSGQLGGHGVYIRVGEVYTRVYVYLTHY